MKKCYIIILCMIALNCITGVLAVDNWVNVTIYNESNEASMTGYTVKLDLIYSNSTAVNYSTATGEQIIYNLSNGSYELHYYTPTYGDEWWARSYYFNVTGDYTNSTIYVYLLPNTSVSTKVTLYLYDQSYKKASDITVYMQRLYIYNGTSSYKTVQMAKTNTEGQTALYTQLYDTWYKLIYLDGGEVLKTTSPSPFFSETLVDYVNTVLDYDTSFNYYGNIYHNVSFLNSTGTIYARFEFVDTGGIVVEGCLDVKRMSAVDGLVNICHNCTSSSSATLTCIVDENAEGEYIATGSIDTTYSHSFITVASANWKVFKTFFFGKQGAFYSAIAIGTLVMMGVGSIMSSFVFLLIGIIGFVSMGFITGFTMGYIWYFVAFVFILLALIIKKGEVI